MEYPPIEYVPVLEPSVGSFATKKSPVVACVEYPQTYMNPKALTFIDWPYEVLLYALELDIFRCH